MKKIILEKKHKKYFLLQRNNYLSNKQKKLRKLFGRYFFTNFFVNYFNSLKNINSKLNYDFRKEFEEIIKFLPQNVNYILDIGSGLGIIDIYFNNYFINNPFFVLIDKNRIEKKVKYGFEIEGQAYNNINITKNFLIRNGIEEKQLTLIDAEKEYEINQNFDLIISLLSMGYHYPLDQYKSIFKNNTNKNTVFIFDIADEYNDMKKIESSKELRHNYIRVCCTNYNKK